MSAPRVALALALVVALAVVLFFALRPAARPPEAQRQRDEGPQDGGPLDEKQARAAAHFAVLAAERYLASGEPEQALVEARRARALAPELPAPHRVLAVAHKLAGDAEAACGEMRRYVEKAGSSPEVRARLLKTVCADAG